MLYKEAIRNLLDLTEYPNQEDGSDLRETEEEWLTPVRMHEESVHYKACLKMKDSANAQKSPDEIIHLQRIAFFCEIW
jgi:hypothetical protein